MSGDDVKEDVKIEFEKTDPLTTYHKGRFFYCLAMLFEELAFMNNAQVSECLARYKVAIKQNPENGLRSVAIDFPQRVMTFLDQEVLPEPIRPSNRPRPETTGPELVVPVPEEVN